MAKWIRDKSGYICPFCKTRFDEDTIELYVSARELPSFCPRCDEDIEQMSYDCPHKNRISYLEKKGIMCYSGYKCPDCGAMVITQMFLRP